MFQWYIQNVRWVQRIATPYTNFALYKVEDRLEICQKKMSKAKILKFRRICFNIFKVVKLSQPAFTCSELTIKTLEQGVKYVQS